MKNNLSLIKRSSGLADVSVVKVYNMEHEFDNHFHSRYCIGLITEGERCFSVNGSSYILKKNDMYICHPEEVHKCSMLGKGPQSYTVLCFPAYYIEDIVNLQQKSGPGLGRFQNYIQGGDGIVKNFLAVCGLLLKSSEPVLGKEDALYSFLEVLIEKYGDCDGPMFQRASKQKMHYVLQVKKYISEHSTENISLMDLSELYGLSPYYINRIFKQEVGISLHTYHLQVRIEQSSKMLVDGCSLADIALHFGFVDQSHFSRFFKKFFGVSPGVYIKQNGIE